MRFSIIIPSYNQIKFVEATLKNIVAIKQLCKEQNTELEVIVCDNCSISEIQFIFEKYIISSSICIIK